jgi:polyisoprenoid-binding protein YceI
LTWRIENHPLHLLTAVEHPCKQVAVPLRGVNMKRFALSAAAIALLFWPSVLPAASYRIDPAHSVVGFTVRHMMVSNVSGAFSKLSGTVDFDPSNPSQSMVDVTIDAASVDTRNSGRDNDLRSANFFDVATYPAITFRSTRVDKAGQGKYRVVGNLTMHGVTKEVVLDVDGPTPEIRTQGRFRAGASASTKIDRKDFGITWNRALDNGGVVVSDEVRINIEVELVRPAVPPAS